MPKFLKIILITLALMVLTGSLAFLLNRETIPNRLAVPSPTTGFAEAQFTWAIAKSRQDMIKVRQDDFYPSLSLSVVYHGMPVWTETIGLANLQPKKNANPKTLYPIGSISKPLTSALVMKLVEDGHVDLDLPISTYASNLPIAYQAVTLRHLLSHQAGVRHYEFAFTPPVFTENGLNRAFATTQDSLALFINDPLLFAPDTSFAYSTFGYTLVSYVLEQAMGTDFLPLMQERLFDPLGMEQTVADHKTAKTETRATDYLAVLKKLGLFHSPQTNSSYKWAGGGFLSTPTDLADFGATLLDGSFLSPVAFSTLTNPRRQADGQINPQKYGLGWRKGTMPYPRDGDDRVPIIHHGGTAAGSECALMLVPTFEMTVAVCGNAFTGGSGGLIQLAADIARNFKETIDRPQ